MDARTQLFKGTLSTIILKMLSEEGRMYGYEITKRVKDQSNGGLNLTEGALYPALHKLEAEGLLEVSVEMVGNRPRKYYALTKNGKKEVKSKLKELTSFLSDLQILLNLQPHT